MSGRSPSRRSLPAEAVLFDLDGTLVHTAPDLAEAVNRMLQDLGRARVDERSVEGWIGDGVARLVKRALTGERDAEPAAELFEGAHARFLVHYELCVSRASRPFPGAREGLSRLREAQRPLACVTSKLAMFTRPLLRDLGLADFFEVVVAGDSVDRRKPDPMPLLHACTRLGVEPAEAVYVGDSLVDARAARAAGTAFVAVSYGYHGAHPPDSLGADRLIDSIADLPSQLAPRAGAGRG